MKKILLIIITVFAITALTACTNNVEIAQEQSTGQASEQTDGKAQERETQQTAQTQEQSSLGNVEKDFGTYNVFDGWYEDTDFAQGAFTYIPDGTVISVPFDSVSVSHGTNRYTVDEHEMFRDAILEQLVPMLPNNVQLNANGFFTEKGYNCYEFEILYPADEAQRQAYIVGEKEFVLIDEMNFGGEESTGLFYEIINSFEFAD